MVSSGREPPPPALSGPDVTVSCHPAPTGRPAVRARMRCQWAKSVGSRFRAFRSQAHALSGLCRSRSYLCGSTRLTGESGSGFSAAVGGSARCQRSSNPAGQRACVQVIPHPDVQVIPHFRGGDPPLGLLVPVAASSSPKARRCAPHRRCPGWGWERRTRTCRPRTRRGCRWGCPGRTRRSTRRRHRRPRSCTRRRPRIWLEVVQGTLTAYTTMEFAVGDIARFGDTMSRRHDARQSATQGRYCLPEDRVPRARSVRDRARSGWQPMSFHVKRWQPEYVL